MQIMNPLFIASGVFACLFGAAMMGMWLRRRLPEHHLSADTKDAVRVGMASVATMSALVLGLLVASTKSTYDTERAEVIQMATKIAYLDRVLANFGPESRECRMILLAATQSSLRRMWPDSVAQDEPSVPTDVWTRDMPMALQKLSATDDAKRAFRAQAGDIVKDLGQMRWLLYEQAESSISIPLLIIMVFWLAATFVSVGLFAPFNAVSVVAQLLAAFSVSGAVYLILEFDGPFAGLVKISNEPMLNALNNLMK